MRRTAVARATQALACVAAFGALWRPAASAQVAAADAVRDPDAYAVYAAVLASGWPKPEAPKGTVAIEEKTAARTPCPALAESSAAESRAAVESYQRENRAPRRLLPGANLGVPYELITSEKYEDLIMIAAGDTREVFAGYWAGIPLTLSDVGFNPAKTRAVVSVQYLCSTACAGGRFFSLAKENAMWRLDLSAPACEGTP